VVCLRLGIVYLLKFISSRKSVISTMASVILGSTRIENQSLCWTLLESHEKYAWPPTLHIWLIRMDPFHLFPPCLLHDSTIMPNSVDGFMTLSKAKYNFNSQSAFSLYFKYDHFCASKYSCLASSSPSSSIINCNVSTHMTGKYTLFSNFASSFMPSIIVLIVISKKLMALLLSILLLL